MDAARRRDLESSLRARLDAQPATTPFRRLIWLGEQVENYVERWAAFSELSPGRVEGDLFAVVEIGAALVAEELARIPAAGRRAYGKWRRFLDTLDRIRANDETASIAQLRGDFAQAKAELAAANESITSQD
jgi:hypothetical protein